MRKNRLALALALAFPVSLSIVFPVFAQTQPAAQAQALTEPSALSVVTITGNREKTLLLQTPASVGVISAQDIQRTGPMHPQQILGQVPGVAIAVTNGEGHSTAIRQPFTTSPLYLYLEDGIPTSGPPASSTTTPCMRSTWRRPGASRWSRARARRCTGQMPLAARSTF